MLRFLVEEGQAALERVDPVGVSCLCFGLFILVFGLYSRVSPFLYRMVIGTSYHT
jgi:hypothetical protein